MQKLNFGRYGTRFDPFSHMRIHNITLRVARLTIFGCSIFIFFDFSFAQKYQNIDQLCKYTIIVDDSMLATVCEQIVRPANQSRRQI